METFFLTATVRFFGQIVMCVVFLMLCHCVSKAKCVGCVDQKFPTQPWFYLWLISQLGILNQMEGLTYLWWPVVCERTATTSGMEW